MASVRDAASLMLISQCESGLSNKVNVLTVERSGMSSHYPGACVFPGGNLDVTDKDVNWLSVLPKVKNGTLKITDPSGTECNYSIGENEIGNSLSLRICAIRETFEECGILLCRKYDDNCHLAGITSHLKIIGIDVWREKVRRDSKEFLNLCKVNRCYPDVEKLYLWSNWFTPPFVDRRYDTKFFLAVLTRIVPAKPDNNEIYDVEWNTADSYLVRNERHEIFLPPPQLYELSRIQLFSDSKSLLKFADENLKDNYCQQYMPLESSTADGVILLLPGDEEYLEILNMRPYVNETNRNLEDSDGSVLHRIMIQTKNTFKYNIIVRNYQSQFFHVLPTSSSVITNQQSKL